jgi:excisionase family DNA binding protein
MPERLPDLLTVKEVAFYLRVSPSTVYRMVTLGSIPYFRIGSDIRFERRALERWIREGRPRRTS